MEKQIFPVLKPWLKFFSYWPVDTSVFPLHKKIYFGLFVMMVYVPSIYFIVTTNDIGLFFTGITEYMACTMALSQTFALGVVQTNYRKLIKGFEEVWAKCKFIFINKNCEEIIYKQYNIDDWE